MALDDGTEIERLLRRYYPILMRQAANAASETVGIDIAFDLEMEAVQSVLDQLAKQIRNVADTTRETVRTLAGQAAQEGWSPQDFADRLEQSGLFGPERAMLIARTEAASAYSRGSVLAYQVSGVVSSTEWLVTNPCPICEPFAGKIVPLGEAFGDGIEHPPAHPNCRCAIAPILKDIDQPEAVPEDEPEAVPSGTPVADALTLPGGVIGKLTGRTLDVIGMVHGDGVLPKMPVKATSGKTTAGQYRYRSNGESVDLGVSRNSPHQLNTIAHEIGHFIDHQGINTGGAPAGRFASSDRTDPLMEPWRAATQNSRAVQRLRDVNGKRIIEATKPDGTTSEYYVDHRFVDYLLDDREIWARSYAQYIATRSQDPAMLQELADMMVTGAQHVYPKQWTDEDFKPIAAAIDSIFATLGWRK